MQGTYNGSDKRLQYLFQNAKNVGFTQNLSSGTKIGSINIDGISTDIFAPTAQAVSYVPQTTEGSVIGILTIGGTQYILYSPNSGQVSYADLIGNQIEVADGYVLTNDTVVSSQKTYYTYDPLTQIYTPVSPIGTENPRALGWYEADSGEEYTANTYQVGKLTIMSGDYRATTDTTVDPNKTYYSYDSSTGQYTAVTPSGNENPSQEGWYELNASVIPIHTPPAVDVTYSSTLQSGIKVGDLSVKTIRHNPQHEDEAYVDKIQTFEIIVPTGTGSGSIVSWTPTLLSGEKIGTLTIDGYDNDLYAPSGGSGNVADVYVNGSSVLDANHIAQIDLTGYATDTELATAIAALQSSFQDGVDSIYNACVDKGSTPTSHSLTDVVAAIYAITGDEPTIYVKADSQFDISVNFENSAEETNGN